MGNQRSNSMTLYNVPYGQYTLINKNGMSTVEKSYKYSSAEERRSLLSLTSILKELQMPTFIQILDVYQTPNLPQYLMVQYEHCVETLKDQIDRMKQSYSKYTQHEIYVFIDCILSGLMALNSKGLSHRDLRPDGILISKSAEPPFQKLYKISYPILMNQNTLEKSYPLTKPVYFGPQMFESVCKLASRSYSLQKNDVFSLGVISLQMATLSPMDSIYNHELGTVNGLEIQKKLRICGEVYSQKITALLRDMLSIDEGQRPNFEEVFKILFPLLEQTDKPQEVRYQQPLQPQRKIQSVDMTRQSSKKLLITSNKKNKPSLRLGGEASPQPVAKTKSPQRSSLKFQQQRTSHMPTYCHVTEPSFLAEIHRSLPKPIYDQKLFEQPKGRIGAQSTKIR